MVVSHAAMNSEGEGTVRTMVYRQGTAHVDIQIRPGAWFGEVRIWRGERWPKLERRWYGRIRRWVPWPSLERQTLKAVCYVSNRRTLALVTAKEVQAAIERLMRELNREI